MSVSMIATKDLKYRTRHLKAGEGFRVKSEREAAVLVHLKRAERGDNMNRKVALDDARAQVGMKPISQETEEIKVWRERYEATLGKRAFNGWSIDKLKEKIADA